MTARCMEVTSLSHVERQRLPSDLGNSVDINNKLHWIEYEMSAQAVLFYSGACTRSEMYRSREPAGHYARMVDGDKDDCELHRTGS